MRDAVSDGAQRARGVVRVLWARMCKQAELHARRVMPGTVRARRRESAGVARVLWMWGSLHMQACFGPHSVALCSELTGILKTRPLMSLTSVEPLSSDMVEESLSVVDCRKLDDKRKTRGAFASSRDWGTSVCRVDRKGSSEFSDTLQNRRAFSRGHLPPRELPGRLLGKKKGSSTVPRGLARPLPNAQRQGSCQASCSERVSPSVPRRFSTPAAPPTPATTPGAPPQCPTATVRRDRTERRRR